jgi:hypothetical protein
MASAVLTLAATAADTLHELALLTRPAITAMDVNEVAALTAVLAELTAAVPQTLRQLATYLPDQDADHQLNTTRHVIDAQASLRAACAAATHLATALDAAHQTLGNTAETPQGVKIQPTIRGQISTGVDNVHARSVSAAGAVHGGTPLEPRPGTPPAAPSRRACTGRARRIRSRCPCAPQGPSRVRTEGKASRYFTA